MWDLPGPGLESVSPALAGGFLTTAPPGKPSLNVLIRIVCLLLIAEKDQDLGFIGCGKLVFWVSLPPIVC